MKYFSMFSGIGGFEYGIQRTWDKSRREQPRQKREYTIKPELHFESINSPICVGYSEIDKYAIKVYERHFGGHKNYGDATKINPKELPDFDLLVGGFPCQAFSIAGKRKGFDDTRGTLFFDIARILAEKKPQHLVLENVKGLLSHDQGRTFQTIIGVLADLGYRVEWQVLNSKDFGVPQNRERIIIVGHLRGECRGKVFPITRENRKISENVFIDESQRRREGKLREYKGISPTLNTNGGGGHLPLVAPAQWRRTEKGKQARRDSQKQGKDYTPFGQDYRELVPKNSNIIGTITSQAIAKDSLVFAPRIRRLTPKECERLQGFPDDWTKYGIGDEPISDTQRYKMCGNAVTTNVITAVMERLI